MCGICGVVELGGGACPQVIAPETLAAMTDAMHHRGPDDAGRLIRPGVAIGVRRLSVIDVAGGHQPLANEDGTVWGAQNGELYNHRDLRRGLEAAGHRFRSRCDTEVIPHLYEEHGVAFAEHLRGMFGLVAVDLRRRRVVVARDRLGVKPLYYAVCRDRLVFASELKGLLASGLVDGELDYAAIHSYLTLGYFPTPATPLSGVLKLPAGHRLVVEDGELRVERYWAYPAPAADHGRHSADEWAARLLAEIDEAVRLRLMSDVPLGVMLSGGLDSSLITALMARAASGQVKTFSVGFTEDGRFNELAEARRVARLFATDHHELELSLSERAVDLEALVWSLDEPIGELSALGFSALSQLARRHVTVALSGQGADELLGGYRKHRAASMTGGWRRVPHWMRAGPEHAAGHGRVGASRSFRTLTAVDGAERHLAMSGLLGDGLRDRLFAGPLAAVEGDPARAAIRTMLADVPDDPLPTSLFLDAQLALVDNMLHYFDRTSMAHSLEVRVPFMDHGLVEFCARIPSHLKVHPLGRKYLLKRAAGGLLPASVIHRRKVGFFRGSAGSWLDAQIDAAVPEHLLRPDARYAEFLRRDAVEDLVRERRAGRGSPQLLLAVLMLEVWLSSYLPRALAPARRPVGRREPVTT